MSKQIDRIGRYTTFLLDCLDGSFSAGTNSENRGIQILPIETFNPIEPLFEDLNITAGEYDRAFFMDVHPRDLGDWDVCILSPAKDEENRFQLTRFCRVRMSEIRGTPIRSEWLGRVSIGFIDKEGSYWGSSMLVNWFLGRWIQLKPERYRTSGGSCDGGFGRGYGKSHEAFQEMEAESYDLLACMLGIAFTRDYEWVVRIGKPDGWKIQFVTDPQGARAAFKLREAPTTESRRQALRNWVTGHWRKCRMDSAETSVREHLRGATSFMWGRLSLRDHTGGLRP